jgi:stage II sporulation protein D
MKNALRAIAVISTLLMAGAEAFGAGPPDIRVLIIDDAAAVAIEGIGYSLEVASPGTRAATRRERRVTIRAGEKGLVLDGKDAGEDLLIQNKSREYKIADRTFGGVISVHFKSSGHMMAVDSIPIEKYLVGLVGSEISPGWPKDAIKAQIVAARTYALSKIDSAKKADPNRAYDITSTITSQVYHGSHVEDGRAYDAVRETSGEVLYRDGAVFPSYYHSCCGGRTEYAHNVWDSEKGPPIVEEKYCERSPKFTWDYSIRTSEFASKMTENGVPISGITGVATTAFQDSPRVQMLIVEDKNGMQMIESRDLRRILGYTNVKSTWFEATFANGTIKFTGRGYGHGVGMCQWGAKGMAEDGVGYKDILKFYYSDATLGRAY